MASREDAADYLASLSTDELINFVAENLTTPRRPDPSAGKGDNAGKPASVAEVMAARRDARAATR